MKSIEIYEGAHQWIMFGRDEHKLDKIIDSNQYMVRTPNCCLLLDPGGIEVFASMMAAALRYVPL